MPRRLVAAAVLSSVLGGCGYSLSGPKPDRPRNQIPECDTSKGFVVIDGLMATVLGVATLSMLNTSEPAVALLPLSIGAIYLGGAIKGASAVNECNKARSEWEQGEIDREVLADDDEPPRKQPRKPSEILPQVGYSPTPYPGQGQPAYSPANPPTQPTQYTAPATPRAPVAQPPVAQPPDDEPVAQPPRTQPVQQPPRAQPPVQPPRAQPPTPPRIPPRAPPAGEDDWSDFWREVP